MTPEQLAANGSEEGAQAAVFCFCAHPENLRQWPDLAKLFAINNNAGKGDAIRGARAKRQGVKAGVFDCFLPVARHGMHGLFLEMKVPEESDRKARVSDAQKQFWKQAHADGYGCAVAYGFEQARDILIAYLSP